jgi:hypothetical protein
LLKNYKLKSKQNKNNELLAILKDDQR